MKNKGQAIRLNYFLKNKNSERLLVCQKNFLAALKISQRNILTIGKKKAEGQIIERRGGDRRRKKYEQRENSVKKFIGNLYARESHYNRQKSKRLYLSSDLNIAKLSRLYNDSVELNLKVSRRYFYNIFVRHFNLGFGNPAKDVCSLCTRLKNTIKSTKDTALKVKSITELRIHTLRAKQFHIFLKESPENSFTVCFDLQQVHALPKMNIGEAFYLRQLALYNFCITEPSTRCPCFYTWIENQAKRGPNEIGSALYHFLTNREFPESCKLVRLFADGCGGQNKNSFIIHMLMFWLSTKAPKHIEEVVLYFPVRGHSYLPADRVFGRIEKICRKRSEITTKEEYWNIFGEVGNVKVLGQDWDLLDWKDLSGSKFKKISGIQEIKRVHLKRVREKCLTKLEVFYRIDNDKQYQNYLKRGAKLETYQPKPIELRNSIKRVKLENVETLLKHYQEKWEDNETFEWYKNLLDEGLRHPTGEEEEVDRESHDVDPDLCDCAEEDIGLKI